MHIEDLDLTSQTKQERYATLLKQVVALGEGERDEVAVMVYPGLNGVQHDAVAQTISYRVNSTQHYVENSYDPESTLMVGMSADDKFSLTSLYGWYKISLPKSYVFKSLYFRGNDGEQLTGTACYSYAEIASSLRLWRIAPS